VQPHIIHSWFAQTTFYARTFLRDEHVPRVFQVPGPLHLESPVYRYADVLSANSDDSWIGTSRYINDLYSRSGVAQEKLALAYIPTDIHRFVPTEKGHLRAKLGIPNTKRIIGMVAHIYPPHPLMLTRRGVKGHEDLIDAFSILQRRRDDVVLVIVGKAWDNHTWYEQRIRDYARRRCGNGVLFAGFVDDVRDAFADFDLFVHPARSENLGGVFEALLLGVPTIGSNVGGIPEAVKDGETGLLVDPTNHQLLADRIEELLDDPVRAHALATRGKQHIREVMDLDRSVQSVIDVYDQLLGGNQ
jgi:glycosyltransferase involved in cell wall biosynthesis